MSEETKTMKTHTVKSSLTAFFLALFFGPSGVSEFYLRRGAAGSLFLIVSAFCFLAVRFPQEVPFLKEPKVLPVAAAVVGFIWILAVIRAFQPAGAATESAAAPAEEKDRTPQSAVEFQPDALEIKNSRLPLAIRLCVWVPFVVVIAAIVWSSIAEVDVVVQAHGKVITDKQMIVLKPYDRVFVKSVKVKLGDIVEKDQVLIEFNPEIYHADRDRLLNDV